MIDDGSRHKRQPQLPRESAHALVLARFGRMNPSLLPHPATLRRRHEALAAAEELVAGSSDDHRYYGAEPPHRYWFDSGSGDFYEFVIDGDDALLTVFDHESPRSPWAREDGLPEWPGMFDGLPEQLRQSLPEREEDEPWSVSACYWFTDGAWREGHPEPVPREGDLYDDDPGGAAGLLAQLLDPESEVRELVGDVYEQPERVGEALGLIRSMGIT